MSKEKFSILKRIKSFEFAFNGLKILFKEEHNARIHALAIFCSLITGFLLKFSLAEWSIIILLFGFVLAAETINSAIENLCDFISPEKQPQIKKIKDLSAAAVLICALTAFIIGCIIVMPKLGLLLFH